MVSNMLYNNNLCPKKIDLLNLTGNLRTQFCFLVLSIRQWLEKLSAFGSFINVHKTLKLFTTIPVTTCSCKRAFSKLSLVKTKLRSQMEQDWLDSMMMISMEQELASQINPEEIIDGYSRIFIPEHVDLSYKLN